MINITTTEYYLQTSGQPEYLTPHFSTAPLQFWASTAPEQVSVTVNVRLQCKGLWIYHNITFQPGAYVNATKTGCRRTKVR